MRNPATRRRIFEIAMMVWALALVTLGAIHLTSGLAHADDDWLDCGDACAAMCLWEGSECEGAWEWFGCGCSAFCLDGSSGEIYCI